MDSHCNQKYLTDFFSGYKRRTLAATPKTAAVLLLLIPSDAGCSVVLTKRVRSLEHHGGEVSFPGGIREADDATLEFTALRETYEEIGIRPSDINVLGALDDELSRWGHRVTPFAAVTGSADFVINSYEVDRLYQVPLKYLFQPDIYWTETWFRRQEGRTVHFYKYGTDIVWGLTALILNKFLTRIAAE